MTDTMATSQSSTVTVQQPAHDPDEINLLEYIYAIVKNKWLIIGATALGLIGGYVAAKLKGPTWVAEVVIAPKEAETQKTPNFSSLGAFGGIVASQLNIGGNASLDKIEVLLGSRDFNARFIEHYDLLPVIYRYAWPKAFALEWDSSANDWKTTFKKPELLVMGDFLKGKFIKKTVKENLMTLEINSRDSAVSINLAQKYIEFLNDDLKASVQKNAKDNVEYLEHRLISIGDPLLREKIQALIADEIEKTMVVSKEAFRVVDPVFLYRSFKEKRMYPILFGSGLFILILLVVVFMKTMKLLEKSASDGRLIREIKKELFLNRR